MKLAIFDCDGTIADSQHLICAAMDRAFDRHEIQRPGRAGILSIVGLSLNIAITRLLADPGASPEFIHAVCDTYRREFAILRSDPTQFEPMFHGAHEAIARIAQREDVLLGIATGKSRAGIDRILERENLDSFFMTIQTADDHPSKPHPSMILTAIAEAGVEAQDTVMIGDTTFDIDMARAAGVGAIGVTWGYHAPGDLRDACAHALVDTFDALEKEIDGVWNTRAEAAA